MSFFFFLIRLTLWFRDLYRESNYIGIFNYFIQITLKVGIIFFILSELMFFFTFFWTYFHFIFIYAGEFSFQWPPICFNKLDFIRVPLLNTIILLTRGISLTISHNYLLLCNKINSKYYLIVTVILGIIFTVYQIWEFYYLDFLFSDSAYGSIFYLGTGFHGTHVLLGTVAILTSFNLISNNYIKLNSSLFELSAWYWHFVDVIWLILFTEFYWWINFK